jgi:hypothetical protein
MAKKHAINRSPQSSLGSFLKGLQTMELLIKFFQGETLARQGFFLVSEIEF